VNQNPLSGDPQGQKLAAHFQTKDGARRVD